MKNPDHPHPKVSASGFSLIELMITLTLLGLIGVGVASAYNFFLRSSIEARTIAELRHDSLTSLEGIRGAIARADRAEVITGPGGRVGAITTPRSFFSRSGLDFSASQKLTLPGYRGMAGASARSIGFWLVQDSPESDQTILSFGGTGNGEQWRLYTESDNGTITVDIGGQSISGSSTIADGNWNHIMVTFDNASSSNFTTDTISIEVNGIPETLGTANSTTPAVNTDNATTAMTIGGGTGDSGFIGQLASIKVWHRALAGPEKWPEVLAGDAVSRDGLMLELLLADTVADSAGNSHGITGFANPQHLSLDRSYASKTSFTFAASPG